VARLSMTQAVALLGAKAVIAVDEANGRELELTPLSHAGTRLTATADRLRIGESDVLVARVHDDDLRPWLVGLEIESAAFQSAQLAKVVLRARSIRLDERHRQADRTSLGGHARLVAVNCQNVVDGDVVEGSIVDVSDNGVALLTQRLLRAGDRLDFSGRFFATVVTAEVRVARVTTVDHQLLAGCTFISIDPAERRKLREVTAFRPVGEPADFSLLQLMAAERVADEEEPRTGLWRRVRRRNA
jgi:PilZ domain